MTKITNCIRRLRFEHGEITQEELGRKAGCTRQTIIALEAGKYTPSLSLAFRLARAFNRQVEDVFQYEVPVQREDGTSSSREGSSQ